MSCRECGVHTGAAEYCEGHWPAAPPPHDLVILTRIRQAESEGFHQGTKESYAEIERLREGLRLATEALEAAGPRWVAEQAKAVRLARFEAFGEAIDIARSFVTPLHDGGGYPSHEAAAETAEELARRIEELRSAAKPRPASPDRSPDRDA